MLAKPQHSSDNIPVTYWPLQTTVVNGVRLSDSGANDLSADTDCILLLHGLGNSLDYWTAVFPLLAMSRRTIALDIPGFGESSPPPGTFTLTAIATAIATVIEAQHVAHLDVIGHSMGGLVALALATAYPDLVCAVTLVDATLFSAASFLRDPATILADPALGAAVIAQFVGGSIPLGNVFGHILAHTSLVRQFALWPYVSDPSRIDPALLELAIRHNGGCGSLKALLLARSMSLEDLASSTGQRTELIWGERDRLLRGSDIARSEEVFSHLTRLSCIPDCGHWPMLERPEDLATLLSLPT